MSFSHLLLILFAAFLHALWNVLVKGGNDPLSETALVAIGAFLAALPFCFFLPLPDASALPLLLFSPLVHFLYYYSMAKSYAHCDLSVSYALMRGLAPLITTVVLLFCGVPISTPSLSGIVVLCLGVVLLAFDQKARSLTLFSFQFPAKTAVVIACYTIIDGFGAAKCRSAFSYAVWLFLLQMLPITIYLVVTKKQAFVEYARKRFRVALFGGIVSFFSYTIALYVMRMESIAVTAALRETSVLFALLLSIFFLGERVSVLRVLSIVLVTAGALFTKLG